MRELARFAGAVAVIALVALMSTPGPPLSATRFVDGLVVLVAAVVSAFCAVAGQLNVSPQREGATR